MEREGKIIHFGARSCRQSAVDGEAALRQLTWALHLILAGENASVNRRRDQVISFCEDERLASPGSHPREDYPSLKPSERASEPTRTLHLLHRRKYTHRKSETRQTDGREIRVCAHLGGATTATWPVVSRLRYVSAVILGFTSPLERQEITRAHFHPCH